MADQGSALASAVRSVAVAGDVSNSVIVTGDDVVVQLRVDGDDALLANLLTGPQVPQRTLRTLPLDGVPAPSPDHLDRAAETQAVRAGVADARTYEIHGPADIGKTFVVTSALGAAAAVMPDGTIYVFAKDKSYGELLQEIYEAFYACEPPCVMGEQQVRCDLANRQALVVLDSLELARDEIRQLGQALPGCRLVLVARQRPLGEGGRLALGGLAPRDALTLVEQELRRPLAAGERAAAEQLVALLDGHPFELRQATADVRDGLHSFEVLARELAAPPASGAWPAAGAAGDPASAALAALLLCGLSEQEKAVIAQLAALRGATIGTEHIPAPAQGADVAGLLRGLEARRLVVSGSPRYRIAGTLQNAVSPDAGALDRMIAQLAPWAATNRRRPERVLAEAPALLALMRRSAAAGRDADVVALGRASDAAFAWGRRWRAWGDVLEAVLAAATRIGDRNAEAWARHQLGTRAYCLGDVSGAVASLEAALRARVALGDEAGAAATRYNLDFIAAPPAYGGQDRDGEEDGGGGRARGRSLALLVTIAVVVAGLGAAVAIGLGGGGSGDDSSKPAPTKGVTTQVTTRTPHRGMGNPQTRGRTKQLTLIVTRVGDGQGTISIDGAPHDCGKPCVIHEPAGTRVTLIAQERQGSTFVGWSTLCADNPSCPLTLDRSLSLMVTFKLPLARSDCTDGVDNDDDGFTDRRDPECRRHSTEAPPNAPPATSPPPTGTTPPNTTPPKTTTGVA